MPLDMQNDDLAHIAETFQRDGYVIVRGVLSAAEMKPILEQWQRVRDPLRAGDVIDGIKRDNFYIHGKLPAPVGDVYRHPTVLAVARQLLGPDVAIYINRLNVKDQAFHDLIHLHQDIPYFNGGEHKINFFIALQDINLNNGAMVYMPKSHHLGILDRKTIEIEKHPELDVIVPSLQPGDLVIADIRLWHASVPNTLNTDRVLLQMVFQPANDGSFYPLSVPEPTLATGTWKTNTFKPWQLITAATTSQLDRDLDPGADSMKGPGIAATSAVDVKPAIGPEIGPEIRVPIGATVAAPVASAPVASSPPVVNSTLAERPDIVAQLKARVPVWIKQSIKDVVIGKKKTEQPNTTPTLNLLPTPVVPSAVVAAAAPGVAVAVASPTPAHVLPELFTASTGPKQVWPLAEKHIDWAAELSHTARLLVKAGKQRVLCAVRGPLTPDVLIAARGYGLDVKGYVHVAHPGEPALVPTDGLPVYTPDKIRQLSGIDAIVVFCTVDFSLVIRRCEQYLRPDILFVPASREAIVAAPVRDATVGDWATRSSILTYLYVSGMRGNFAEFGTFWGRAFYGSYYELHHWLQGKFFAFDSFEGLSEPDPSEIKYTSGDFIKGAYGFNHASFDALADILDIPKDRVVTVPGFFDKSLTAAKAAQLGIAPKSLSVCRIDCDLLDPTLSVLDFITPLLEDGALIYFDDWRLCRADPNIGERGAVLRWLKNNPSFELVDFHSIHWQHQWFIFHRNRPQ